MAKKASKKKVLPASGPKKKTAAGKPAAKKAPARKATGSGGAASRGRPKAGPVTVEDYMTALDHPLKAEVEVLRRIVQAADRDLVESIKWNAPSYAKDGEDRITLNLSAGDEVRIVFHRGAKLKDPKRKGRLIADASGLLTWPADDRAVASFATMTEIESARAALRKIITTWLAATSV